MNKTVTRYLVLNLGLFALLMLIILSITGAFLGAQKAKLFFNSPPLAVFWILLTLLFGAGLIFWKSLRRRPFLLMCHTGCMAVLIGGLWGSQAAHRLRAAAGMEPKLTKGVMTLHQGQTGRRVFLDDQTGVFELPFTVRLAETAAAFYDDPILGIYNAWGKLIGTIPAAVAEVYELPDAPDIKARVKQRFANLRLTPRPEGGIQAVEGQDPQGSPGYEVVVHTPEENEYVLYVFERWESHFVPHIPFLARYFPPRMPKEYKSRLILEKDSRILTQKTIRVNAPLYCAGYHFYQSTFGRDEIGPYSGIMVVSDSGVWTVFSGYALITLGLFGQFWVQPILRRRTKQETA